MRPSARSALRLVDQVQPPNHPGRPVFCFGFSGFTGRGPIGGGLALIRGVRFAPINGHRQRGAHVR